MCFCFLKRTGVMPSSAQRKYATFDFFASLKRAIRERGATVRSLFNEYDKDKNGCLTLDEYTALFQDLVPGCTKADIEYFVAMIDTGGRTANLDRLKDRRDSVGTRKRVRNAAGNAKLEVSETGGDISARRCTRAFGRKLVGRPNKPTAYTHTKQTHTHKKKKTTYAV